MVKKVGTLKNGVNDMEKVLKTIASGGSNKLALTVSKGVYYLCTLPKDVDEIGDGMLQEMHTSFVEYPQIYGKSYEGDSESFIDTIGSSFPDGSRVPLVMGSDEYFGYVMDYILGFYDSGEVGDENSNRNFMRIDLNTKEIVFYTNWSFR